METALTESQQQAFDLLQNEDNIFLSGAAGTGKSFVIKEFLKTTDVKKFPVLASTGAAAVLIGGRTFHSFFGIGILEGGPLATVERALKDRRVVRRLQKIEGFILDEVSMLSAQVIEVAESIASRARKSELIPWGGLKVIAVGDFAQLPPVERSYSGKPWAFLSPAWKKSRFTPYILKQNLRSSNADFLSILEKVRNGIVDDHVETFLESRILKVDDSENITRLYPRRDQTEKFNQKKLKELEGETIEVKSIYMGSGQFIERLKKQSPILELLQFKIGSLIMLRQNDPKQRWVNGSTGIIEKLQEDQLKVKLLNNDRIVNVDKVSFSMLDSEGRVVASVTNFPINLAYAATIHKSQGMTLDQVQVDLRSLWEPGQAYVALSRVTSPDGLYLTGWDRSSIKTDDIVSRYYNYLASNSEATH